MPKGIQNINPEKIERLKAKLAHSLAFSLNTNKSYDQASNIIFERTGALLSSSTLRRVFQYDSVNNPTKSTLDLICKSIGFQNWDDFVENEKKHSQSDLSQLIAMFKFQGIENRSHTTQILQKFSKHPDFFKLLDAVVQIAISNRDIEFLSKLFDIKGIFEKDHISVPKIYFIHNLVIGLNQSGIMPELIDYYGANENAQCHLVESFVDEDNLNGYFYDLMQVYHKHKTTPEAQLFYHCLMYQHTIENNLPANQHLDFIRQFSNNIPVHHIPKGRRYAILLLEAGNDAETITDILNKTSALYRELNDVEKITTALYMVRLLFLKQKDELIDEVLFLAPDIIGMDKNIDDQTNINQLKIYRAYSLIVKGKKQVALEKLNEFDPLLVQAFIYNHIMNDFHAISKLLTTE